MTQPKLSGTVELAGPAERYSVRLVEIKGVKEENGRVKIGKIEYLKGERVFVGSEKFKPFLNSLNLKDPGPSAPAVSLGPGVMGRLEFSDLTLEQLVKNGLLKPVSP